MDRHCTGLMAWVVVFLSILGGAAWSITPEEVFQDGRRAFELGHWLEAKEHFARFHHTWPGHTLGHQALLMETLAEIRGGKVVSEQADAERLADLSARYRALREKLDASELVELSLAIQEKQDAVLVASPAAFLLFPPQTLEHLLARGFIKEPSVDPLGTLDWIRSWRARHDRQCSPQLRGRLELWRAKALWTVWLSPLPAGEHAGRLQKGGDWPLVRALQRSLGLAFRDGGPSVKRETALLGVSVDALAAAGADRRRPLKADSEWLTYLHERGIHAGEAWCPR